MKSAFWYDCYVMQGGKVRHVKTDCFRAHTIVEFYQELNRWNAQAAMFPATTDRPRWLYVAREARC